MTKYDGTTPGLSTRCVHAGEKRDAQGAIHPALYNHSTFGFENTADLLDVVEGRTEGNLYTRYGLNPTIRSLEKKLADLENGEAALAFGSGMAAEAATFFAHAKADDHIVCIGDVYGGTYELLSANLPEVGIETTFLLADEVSKLPSAVTDRTRIVFFETPTNPALDVIDVSAVAEVARAAGALTVVDNTFATPVNQNPLDLGANLVVHSATKYLGGHSDLTGGVVIGNAELLAPISMWRCEPGTDDRPGGRLPPRPLHPHPRRPGASPERHRPSRGRVPWWAPPGCTRQLPRIRGSPKPTPRWPAGRCAASGGCSASSTTATPCRPPRWWTDSGSSASRPAWAASRASSPNLSRPPTTA